MWQRSRDSDVTTIRLRLRVGRGAADVVVSCGCGDVVCGPLWKPQSMRLMCQPGHLPYIVAALACAAGVFQCGGAVVAVTDDVIEVSDGCVAVGVCAGLVAESDELA